MADRIFSSVILLLVAGYSYLAFFVIRAPFQYDPLGPESWPQILGLATIPCCLLIIAKPDVAGLDAEKTTLLRILTLIGLLFAYAWLFQPLGFILSTILFCLSLSIILGAGYRPAAIFAVSTGVVGYFVCTALLELNLPAGILKF